jgi:hypothetical protein
MASLKKKVFATVGIVVIATWVAFNLSIARSNGADVEMSLANVEALASEGGFPACQKKEGNGSYEDIPYCSGGKCTTSLAKKGVLDVNYCD